MTRTCHSTNVRNFVYLRHSKVGHSVTLWHSKVCHIEHLRHIFGFLYVINVIWDEWAEWAKIEWAVLTHLNVQHVYGT